MSGFVFLFPAEDGIRDWSVTGVQTCALPISHGRQPPLWKVSGSRAVSPKRRLAAVRANTREPATPRSEERRVGKECRAPRKAAAYRKAKTAQTRDAPIRLGQSDDGAEKRVTR